MARDIYGNIVIYAAGVMEKPYWFAREFGNEWGLDEDTIDLLMDIGSRNLVRKRNSAWRRVLNDARLMEKGVEYRLAMVDFALVMVPA